MKFPDQFGNVTIRYIERPQLISEYFRDANCVDVHNQLRQYALKMEKKWVTNKPYFRLHTFLVALNVVNTYRLANFHSILSSNRAIGFRKIYGHEQELVHNNEAEPMLMNEEIENNAYTMQLFAGVLCHQLIKYVDNDIASAALRTSSYLPRLCSHDRAGSLSGLKRRRGSSVEYSSTEDGDDLSIGGQSTSTTKTSNSTTTTDTMVRVVEEVHDCNGRVHQAVRICSTIDNKGKPVRDVRKRCAMRGRSSCCVSAKTRVQCLQCGLPLCFPLRVTTKNSSKKTQDYCFYTHVHSIKKTRGGGPSKFVSL